MEKDCDAEVNNICSQMTAILKANGRDTAIVREVKRHTPIKKQNSSRNLSVRLTAVAMAAVRPGIGCMIGWNENLHLQQFTF